MLPLLKSTLNLENESRLEPSVIGLNGSPELEKPNAQTNNAPGPIPSNKIMKGELVPSKMPIPTGDRLIIEPMEEPVPEDSKIVIPEMSKEKPTMGRIVAMGPGHRLNNGKRIPIDHTIGQLVVFTKYVGTEIKVDGKKFVVVNESDLLYVLQ